MQRELISEQDIESAINGLKQNLYRRLNQYGYGKFVSPAEALGDLCEEYHEVIDAVRSNDIDQINSEFLDVMVSSLWAYCSFKR